MPKKLKIELPEITEETTDTDVSFLPSAWVQSLIDVSCDEGNASKAEFFFHYGWLAALALLSNAGSGGMTIKEYRDKSYVTAIMYGPEQKLGKLFNGDDDE